MKNKEFTIAGIKNLMKTNYRVATDLIDLESYIDSSLSMSENWFMIKPKVLMLCNKSHKIMFK